MFDLSCREVEEVEAELWMRAVRGKKEVQIESRDYSRTLPGHVAL